MASRAERFTEGGLKKARLSTIVGAIPQEHTDAELDLQARLRRAPRPTHRDPVTEK